MMKELTRAILSALAAAVLFLAPAAARADGGALPGLCQVPQEPATVECETGMGFLCVSTPPGSVAGDSFVLEGTIDLASSALTSVTISAQNEYTKSITSVDTSSPDSSGCWDGDFARPFCLDAEGRFAARIDLPEKGPHTISVTATRLVGDSVERKVRTSRVIAPNLVGGSVTYDPDIAASPSTDAQHVKVAVDLLGGCQFCDFIGASTGGVEVSVENVVTDSEGHEKRIECRTTVEQGGQGLFAIGVPVGKGTNSLTVSVCNAASAGNCPTVGPVAFSGAGPGETVEGMSFLSPEPLPNYDSGEYPEIHWRFRIEDGGACVDVRFNRLAPIQLCPDAQGVYSIELKPRRGINVATVSGESGMEEYAWTFGWGKVMSPHAGTGGAMNIPSAIEVALPARTAEDIVLPLANNFLASDEREAFIDDVLDDMGGSSEDDGISEIIPKCGSNGALDGFTAELRGKPKIGDAVFKNLKFEWSKMDFSVTVDDVEIGIDLIPEKDLPPLPLVIAIRRARLDLSLEGPDEDDLFLLTSPHDDCDYKAGSYCKHFPAALIPKNLAGGASAWGSIVKCDMSLATGKAKEACAAINSLNGQTGIVNEKVLDAINQAIYCGGSAAITRLMRNGIDLPPIEIGGGRRSGSGIVPHVTVPIALDLEGGIAIREDGLLVEAGLDVGSSSTYADTPSEMRIPEAGVIKGKGFGAGSFAGAGQAGGDLGASLALDAVNAFLFAASAQGDGRKRKGLFDIEVDDGFFRALDFDFVAECDAFVATEDEGTQPTLCYVRPRVLELLGTPLTTYGYFPGNQPLMVAVRGNRALGARLAVADAGDLAPVGGAATGYAPQGSLVSLELGGIELAFYALEIDESIPPDEYGNPAVLLDEHGDPVIHSMNPGDPDPLDGQIISFDLTLLAAVEIGRVEIDPEDPAKFAIPLRVLFDRTRIALTPMPGTNSTTVPAMSLVSQLVEELGIAINAFSEDDEPIMIPVPREIALDADDDGLMGALGLASIEFGADGLWLDFEEHTNSVTAAISAIITQVLHVNGKKKTYEVPK